MYFCVFKFFIIALRWKDKWHWRSVWFCIFGLLFSMRAYNKVLKLHETAACNYLLSFAVTYIWHFYAEVIFNDQKIFVT